MSKIYKVDKEGSVSSQIPSIEYINELVKLIQDELCNQNSNFNGFPTIKADIEELPIEIEKEPIHARDIKTDISHKFVSDGLIATIVDKPSRYEMEKSFEELRVEIKEQLNELFLRIINTPNAINKLRDISNILNEDELANTLTNIMAYKVNDDEFKAHIQSAGHITNNDRKALNILIKSLKNGFADWDAEESQYNAVKNKPGCLPADGGNADTIANHNIKDIINRDDYDVVIGSSLERYSKDSCDIYATDGIINSDKLDDLMQLRCTNIMIRRGIYITDTINTNNPVIINGTNYKSTSIRFTDQLKIINSEINNISILDSKVIIKSNCDLNNVLFKNCEIVFSNSESNILMNCRFDHCTFIYDGPMINNVIKFNRYINTKPVVYVGNNNCISDNI